jgi:phage shock protein PspC (stress-responsive transcriptional regulator)
MTTADELSKLHDLLTKGAITQEEFERAKARLLDAGEAAPSSATAAINSFRLSESDKWIAGVCGGISRSTGVDSWIWRLLFVAGLLLGGFTLILYLLIWIFVPREQPSA